MKSVFLTTCLLAVLFHTTKARIVQNCTSAVCDLKTCATTSSACDQTCYSNNCKMSCSSPAGCFGNCALGSCSKVACSIQASNPSNSRCELQCKKDCPDMNCNANSCHMTCRQNNCKMSCDGSGKSYCFSQCQGKGCEINVKSSAAEVGCDQGSCKIVFGKATSGVASCIGGSCSLTCVKGQECQYGPACPNCTGPTFVDPVRSDAWVIQLSGTVNIFLMTLISGFMALIL